MVDRTSSFGLEVNKNCEVFLASRVHWHLVQYLEVQEAIVRCGLGSKVPGKDPPVRSVEDVADALHRGDGHDLVVRVHMGDVVALLICVLLLRLGRIAELELHQVCPVAQIFSGTVGLL